MYCMQSERNRDGDARAVLYLVQICTNDMMSWGSKHFRIYLSRFKYLPNFIRKVNNSHLGSGKFTNFKVVFPPLYMLSWEMTFFLVFHNFTSFFFFDFFPITLFSFYVFVLFFIRLLCCKMVFRKFFKKYLTP